MQFCPNFNAQPALDDKKAETPHNKMPPHNY